MGENEQAPPPPVQKPSPCRDVIFVFGSDLHVGKKRPAKVVDVNRDGTVELCVFTKPTENHGLTTLYVSAVENDETGKKPHSWHWPPRV